jgi:pimeloyl-ACP methyl ester carboxylesterase
VAGTRVPLESDLTTPLAYFLDKPSLAELPTLGFLNPDKYEGLEGLYMVQPYQPGKIPVLMVHGLWSSPITWMEMFNDLRSSPEIRDRYQFWFYLYPTGQPFWVSAAQMRKDLSGARELIDPARREPALDHMVLVGHSMGGLVSKLQSFSSGDEVWRTVSKEPIQLVKADPEVHEKLEKVFYFQADPAVRRIITIGTPHRGSKFANDFTRFAAHKLITVPQAMVRGTQEIYRENPEAFAADSLLNITTSIDSLSPTCPILPVMLGAPRPPWVHHHNIVGVIEDKGLVRKVTGRGDGIVEYDSAHLDNVDSEIVVPADHLHVHRHPLAVLEVRRVLRQHLAEIQSWPRRPDAGPPHPRVYQASAESAGGYRPVAPR